VVSRSNVLPVVLAFALIVAGLLYVRPNRHTVTVGDASRAGRVGCSQVATGFRERENGNWLTVSATVTRLLPDSYGRFQHQRFIARCPSGQTILIVNDVSIGQRVPVAVGQRVVVRGQYVWNEQGGLIHFTHHGDGSGGWILYQGHVYALDLVRGGRTGRSVRSRMEASLSRAPGAL
jgi:hypothetical protein